MTVVVWTGAFAGLVGETDAAAVTGHLKARGRTAAVCEGTSLFGRLQSVLVNACCTEDLLWCRMCLQLCACRYPVTGMSLSACQCPVFNDCTVFTQACHHVLQACGESRIQCTPIIKSDPRIRVCSMLIHLVKIGHMVQCTQLSLGATWRPSCSQVAHGHQRLLFNTVSVGHSSSPSLQSRQMFVQIANVVATR